MLSPRDHSTGPEKVVVLTHQVSPSFLLLSLRFDGVVVCMEFEELLVEAAGEIQQRDEDKSAHQRRSEVTQMWRILLRALATRLRILAEYGS